MNPGRLNVSGADRSIARTILGKPRFSANARGFDDLPVRRYSSRQKKRLYVSSTDDVSDIKSASVVSLTSRREMGLTAIMMRFGLDLRVRHN